MGIFSTATGENSIAIGTLIDFDNSGQVFVFDLDLDGDGVADSSTEQTLATGVNSTAYGASAHARGDGALASGASSRAIGNGTVAIGGALDLNAPGFTEDELTIADGTFATAVGSGAHARGALATANGWLANAAADRTTSLGGNSDATQQGATAAGSFAQAAGQGSTALGGRTLFGPNNTLTADTVASGRFATALGAGAQATGSVNATANGWLANASQDNTTSIGANSAASAIGATAIGRAAKANAENSVALGTGSVADRANTVSVGIAGAERQVANVADGTQATDAVNVRQAQAGDAQTLSQANAYTDERVQALIGADIDGFRRDVDRRFERQDRRTDRVGAMSSAMVQMTANAANGNGARGRLAVGAGFLGGEQAVSIGYGKRLGARASFTLGGAFSGDEKSAGLGFGVDL